MKYVILLALVAVVVAQRPGGGHRPGFDHGDPLHHLIHEEVQLIMQNNPGVSLDHCQTKCDALFDLDAGHDEDITDRLCKEECDHQINSRPIPTSTSN